MKVTDVRLDKRAQANFRGRFLMLVDQSGNGCWPWKGPRHSSGRGRYLWRAKDGGDDKYVLAHRVAYYLATGELPRYLRSLCGNLSCCKASHYWKKPSPGQWKPEVKKAIRGRVRQLSTEEVRHVRLLASLSNNEAEVGDRFGLSKRQVADIALGKVRTEAGGRIRPSRFKGIRQYHREFVQELQSLRPDDQVPHFPVHPAPQVARTSSVPATGSPVPPGRPFSKSYGQIKGRRLPRTGRC